MRILTKILKRKKKLDAVLIETTGRWPMALCSLHVASPCCETRLALPGSANKSLLLRYGVQLLHEGSKRKAEDSF
jgi:hypothetical protein